VLGELVSRSQEIANQDQANGIDTAVGLGDLGLHVWKKGWGLSRRWPFLRRELHRLRTVRLGALPTLRPVRFYKGKGVVGRCWQANDEVIEDNESRYAHIRSESDWLKLSTDQRDRLSYGEFVQTRDRGAILASPIRDRKDRFVGCVSVDIGHGAHIVRDPDLRSKVRHLCIGVGRNYFEGIE